MLDGGSGAIVPDTSGSIPGGLRAVRKGTHRRGCDLGPATVGHPRRGDDMSKFNVVTIGQLSGEGIWTERHPSGHTHEGGPGFARDVKSELFLLAVANFVGEDTFYESAGRRDSRFELLVRAVAVEDIDWLTRFVRWLRHESHMRTASIVAAAEGVKARLENKLNSGNRQLIDVSMARADEPGELLAYWVSHFGRSVPKPVKRGVADAVRRLYGERSLLKYDTATKGFRFGDVIDLVHPTPRVPQQGDLFQYALDRRHNREKAIPDSLAVCRSRQTLMAISDPALRRVVLSTEVARAAGMTWEAVAGWLKGPMDASAWETMIPTMGYMALLRNLRNFDQAGVSDETARRVAATIADPEEVAKSKQLPMRFLSSYRAVTSLRWGQALEQALQASMLSIPQLDGRTLILVDTSGSMNSSFSRDGTLMRWDAAVIFGLALARRCEWSKVVSFSSPAGYWDRRYKSDSGSMIFDQVPGEALLKSVERWKAQGYFIGGGTDTGAAVRAHYQGHDRVIILTDEQHMTGPFGQTGPSVLSAIPAYVPTYTWNLAGYTYGHAPSGVGNRHVFGGLTDAAFKMIPLLEGQTGMWPF